MLLMKFRQSGRGMSWRNGSHRGTHARPRAAGLTAALCGALALVVFTMMLFSSGRADAHPNGPLASIPAAPGISTTSQGGSDLAPSQVMTNNWTSLYPLYCADKHPGCQ
ncbi:MAG: hypothetical protein M3Y76_13610 [Chloroflexota bacterium]|nr:hypothetical protein [Chloroflexota bacterium]